MTELMNVKDVLERLGISYRTLVKILNGGELPFVVIGKRRFFRAEDVERYLRPQTVARREVRHE